MTTCPITGCRLIIGDRHVWGDLHANDNSFIFVAVRDDCRQTNWQHGPIPDKVNEKRIECVNNDIFDVRGAFHLPEDDPK